MADGIQGTQGVMEGGMEQVYSGLQQILASEDINEIKRIAQALLPQQQPQFDQQLDQALA